MHNECAFSYSIKVKNLVEIDFPKIFKDQYGFIHFKTKKFHVWGKNVLDKVNAKHNFDLLNDQMEWKSGQVNMSSYGGDITTNDCPMTKICGWGPYFKELCKLIHYDTKSLGLGFNFFLVQHPNGTFYTSPQSHNSKGWANEMTPFAVLVLTKNKNKNKQ